MIYLHLHIMRRVGWFPKNFAVSHGQGLVAREDGRAERLKAILRGVRDGVTGRLGVRYPITPIRERKGT